MRYFTLVRNVYPSYGKNVCSYRVYFIAELNNYVSGIIFITMSFLHWSHLLVAS